MDLANFREDLAKQKDGSPIYVGDCTFYVRRWGTPESQKYLRDLRRKLFSPFHKDQEGDESLLLSEWLCGYAVTSWENVFDGQNEVKYTKENARNIFTNPEYMNSLNAVLIRDSMNFENYLHDIADEDLSELKKN